MKKSRHIAGDLERKGFKQHVGEDMPGILSYPLTEYALGVLCLFAFFFWLADKAGMLGLPLFLATFSWVFKYAFACLEQTALGYRQPPKLTIELINPVHQEPLKLLILVAGLAYLFMASRQVIGEPFSLAVLLIGLLLLPASILFIAIEDSLLQAINPLQLSSLIQRIGSLYFLACVFSALPIFSLIFVFTTLPLILLAMVLIYFLLLTFHLLGYLVYCRRELIGMPVNISPERIQALEQEADQLEQDEVLDKLYSLAEGSNVRAAWQQLEQYLVEQDHALNTYKQYFNIMIDWPKPALALNLGQAYISRLSKHQQTDLAYEVCRRCYARSDEFYPETSEQALSLINYARKAADDVTADKIIQAWKQGNPPETLPVEMRFIEAQLLLDMKQDADSAREILEELVATRDHPLHPRIQLLLSSLD